MTDNLEPTSGSVFAQTVLLGLGTALSGVLTWFLFRNLYGALVFVVLFVIGVAIEAARQRRAKAQQIEADVAMGDYLSRLYDTARKSGVDLKSPRED
ncbi:hypothetical protein FHT40_003308 [Mycolicibacterium sp. BK556]|uniref:hypothetical protein n=1 Tax=Mycobacteriaceae TaxID=1762 RepID=UPI00105E4D05|nr:MULTISPECIES: hypothetical protein [Mycobacteriaceae]MBB3603647.1 hypothetical protein [Mycolicibacterium sp. BK556]MBB3633842.1 hypothetical protein [Mycolicibacterium sp. BK607]MBB3751424.1 hypothetical protein [Mycolicibacterium sp. BK634]TDO11953.1 hypothetical protein EV580_3677 [Mycobacterium sp. BK086]